MLVKGKAKFPKMLCWDSIDINSVGVTVEGHGWCPLCLGLPRLSEQNGRKSRRILINVINHCFVLRRGRFARPAVAFASGLCVLFHLKDE